MKKILFMLTAAMLTLTACQHNNESLSFLIGEKTIAVDFDYTAVTYGDNTVKANYEKALQNYQEPWERQFIEELNDELEDVFIRAYPVGSAANANYTFVIRIDEVTDKGVLKATSIAYDTINTQVSVVDLKAGREYEHSFIERIGDTMGELGDYLGHQIRRAL